MAFELGGCPGVPIADRGYRVGEFDDVHRPWDAGVASAARVDPVLKKAAFSDHRGSFGRGTR